MTTKHQTHPIVYATYNHNLKNKQSRCHDNQTTQTHPILSEQQRVVPAARDVYDHAGELRVDGGVRDHHPRVAVVRHRPVRESARHGPPRGELVLPCLRLLCNICVYI